MRRFQLFELEDLAWYPATVRDFATDYLQFMQSHFKLHQPLVMLLRRHMKECGAERVVDLCSGGGGPLLAVYEALAEEGVTPQFLLTDKYPNLRAFRKLSALHPLGIFYCAESIDVARVPPELHGMRTLFNALHHFAPANAGIILACAVEAGQPIAIFEFSDRTLATIIPLLLTPLYVWLATPFMRPFQWRRMLWTYVLPMVPLTCLWDGVVSQLRAYRPAEMLELTRPFPTYQWTADRTGLGTTPGHVTYLLGRPKTASSPS